MKVRPRGADRRRWRRDLACADVLENIGPQPEQGALEALQTMFLHEVLIGSCGEGLEARGLCLLLPIEVPAVLS